MNTYLLIGLVVTCIVCLISGITLLVIYIPKHMETKSINSAQIVTQSDLAANSAQTAETTDDISSPADSITASTTENKVQEHKIDNSRPGNSTVTGLMELEREKMIQMAAASNVENERQVAEANRIREQAAAAKAAEDASDKYCIVADGVSYEFTKDGSNWVGQWDNQSAQFVKQTNSWGDIRWDLMANNEYVGQRMARKDEYKETRPADGIWYGTGGKKLGMGGPC